MKPKYKIWTGSGSYPDGLKTTSMAEARRILREHRGWAKSYLAEHCDGRAWSVYGNRRDADEDVDGFYADTISKYDNN